MLPCCLLEALQNATSSRHGLENTGIAQHGVWLMSLAGGIAKPNVWRMRLASHIAKYDVWQMLLSGSIVKPRVCRMWPARNIAERCVRHMWGAAAIRIFALFAHACSQGPWAQPQANSIDWQEHDKQSQRRHQPRSKPRKPPAIAERSGLRLADHIAKRGVWPNAARGEHHKTMGLAVLTCRRHAETRCLANVSCRGHR